MKQLPKNYISGTWARDRGEGYETEKSKPKKVMFRIHAKYLCRISTGYFEIEIYAEQLFS